jgi:hypothetical protein
MGGKMGGEWAGGKKMIVVWFNFVCDCCVFTDG